MLEDNLKRNTYLYIILQLGTYFPNIIFYFKIYFQEEIDGLSNVEKVLLDTADSVMDTKKKLEFGVQQIIFKVKTQFVCVERPIY